MCPARRRDASAAPSAVCGALPGHHIGGSLRSHAPHSNLVQILLGLELAKPRQGIAGGSQALRHALHGHTEPVLVTWVARAMLDS